MVAQRRIKVFISYHHSDRRYLKELRAHLRPFADIQAWDDQQIVPGQEWRIEIADALRASAAVILLVSADALASEFISKFELEPSLERTREQGLKLLWIPVSASSYQKTPLERYEALRDPGSPLDLLRKPQRKRAWVEICAGIEMAICAGFKQRPSQSPNGGGARRGQRSAKADGAGRPQGFGPPETGATKGEGGAHHAATWVFGALLLVFIIYMTGWGPTELPGYRLALLALLCALLVGLFATYLMGSIGLSGAGPSWLGKARIRATGGLALFLIVLAWWGSPYAPVKPAPPPPPETCAAREADELQGRIARVLYAIASNKIQDASDELFRIVAAADTTGCQEIAIQASRLRGDCAVKVKDFDAAREAYSQVWLRTMRAYNSSEPLWNDAADGAIGLYDRISSVAIRDEFAYMMTGMVELLVHEGRDKETKRLLNQLRVLLARSPGFSAPVAAHFVLVRSSALREEVHQALGKADALKDGANPLVALSTYEHAVALARDSECNSPVDVAAALVGQGDCYRLAQQYAAATDKYKEAVRMIGGLSESLQFEARVWKGFALLGLAWVGISTGQDLDQAEHDLIDAEALFGDGHRKGRALAEFARVGYFLQKGDLSSARNQTSQLLQEPLDALLTPRERAHFLWYQAAICRLEDKLPEVETHLRAALTLLQKQPNEKLQVQLVNELVELLTEFAESASEPNKAQEFCQKAAQALAAGAAVLRGENPVAYGHRELVKGRVRECQGARAEAIHLWETALAELELVTANQGQLDRARFTEVCCWLRLNAARGHAVAAYELMKARASEFWDSAAEKELDRAAALLRRLEQDEDLPRLAAPIRNQLDSRRIAVLQYAEQVRKQITPPREEKGPSDAP